MTAKKNFRDYLTKEDLFHGECLKACEAIIPGVRVIHVPNEGQRSKFEAFKFKALGGQEGVSDLFIPKASGFNHGLWVELKCGANKCTESQVDFLVEMHKLGYAAAVVYDHREDFEKLMNAYLDTPELFQEGIVRMVGEMTVLDYPTAKAKLAKRTSAASVRRKAEKSFEEIAIRKFGKPIKGVRLPNAGKLFSITGK